jgi:hypothetical protein
LVSTTAAFRSAPFSSLQLQAVTDDTHVACVGMQQVHRPVFRFLTVVAKGSREF